jgi:hypothetical protein
MPTSQLTWSLSSRLHVHAAAPLPLLRLLLCCLHFLNNKPRASLCQLTPDAAAAAAFSAAGDAAVAAPHIPVVQWM